MANTFPKQNKLCGQERIAQLYKQGKRFTSWPLRVTYMPSNSPNSQVLVWAPKSLFKHAVQRNHLRRLMREAYRLHQDILSAERSISDSGLSSVSPQGGLFVTQQACPMWVPLIEAGEHNGPGAKYFIGKYLRELLAKDPLIDTIVLGCTHYPLMKARIDEWLAFRHELEESEFPVPVETPKVTTIAQGELEAKSLKDYLVRHPEYTSQLSTGGTCAYLTTENADRFSQSASIFLSSPVQAEHIDLE